LQKSAAGQSRRGVHDRPPDWSLADCTAATIL
jgi:hypothetical protein